MSIEFMIWQDDDDVKNRMVQLEFNDNTGKSGYIYFTLDEWLAFKATLDEFHYSTNIFESGSDETSTNKWLALHHLNYNEKGLRLENNPLTQLDMDGVNVDIVFGGDFAIDIVLSKRLWLKFRKGVIDFKPSILSQKHGNGGN